MKLVLRATVSRKAEEDGEDLEQILSSAYWSYKWARDHVKGPWPQGEPVIARDPIFSVLYATECLKLPVGEAEEWGKNFLLSYAKDSVHTEAIYDMKLDRFMRDLTMLRNVYDRIFDQNKGKRR